jgi:hypothetical protein
VEKEVVVIKLRGPQGPAGGGLIITQAQNIAFDAMEILVVNNSVIPNNLDINVVEHTLRIDAAACPFLPVLAHVVIAGLIDSVAQINVSYDPLDIPTNTKFLFTTARVFNTTDSLIIPVSDDCFPLEAEMALRFDILAGKEYSVILDGMLIPIQQTI